MCKICTIASAYCLTRHSTDKQGNGYLPSTVPKSTVTLPYLSIILISYFHFINQSALSGLRIYLS